MAAVNTYLNFAGNTEEAFTFYKAVFGTEFQGPIMRHGDVPPHEGMSELSAEDKQMVIHVSLPILGGYVLMGSDIPESMGMPLTMGNNVYISLHPDTRAEADKLFTALSEGGNVEMEMAEQFWGDYFGSFVDKFGVHWMINTDSES